MTMPSSHRHHSQTALTVSHSNKANPKSSDYSADLSFTTDRRGDPNNVRYGGIDKYAVPRYRTAGYGRLIGLDRQYHLHNVSDTQRRVEDDSIDSRRRAGPLTLLSGALSDTDSPSENVQTLPDDASFVHQDDFIAISDHGKRKRRKALVADGHGKLETLDDRVGDRSPSSSSGPDLHHQSQRKAIHADRTHEPDHVDAFEEFKNHPDNQRHIVLLRLTEQQPANVTAWLELIDHQEKVLLLSTKITRRSLSHSERRTLADMRISLYERALQNITTPDDRERFTIELLQEGAQLWDTNKQMTEWRKVLRQGGSFKLQHMFIKFQMMNSVVFSYDKVWNAYSDLLAQIKLVQDDTKHDEQCTSTLLALTLFLRQSGFDERALAIWQALLEFNFCKPDRPSNEDALSSFETFWDSEVARIGEQGAKGWAISPGSGVVSRSDISLPAASKVDLFTGWGQMESARSFADIFPARVLDETLEDDPFRVIISSDIKDFVINLRTVRGRVAVLQAFLAFGNLPRLNSDIRSQTGQTHAFFRSQPSHVGAGTNLDAPETGRLATMITTADTLYRPPDDEFSAWTSIMSLPAHLLLFATRALRLLVDHQADDDLLAEYAIALVFVRDPVDAKKYAKSLLKKRSESLRLYNAFALMQARSGQAEAAYKTWSTAISMLTKPDDGRPSKISILWHNWIWHILSQGDRLQALHMLVHGLPQGKPELVQRKILDGLEEHDLIRCKEHLHHAITQSIAMNDEHNIAIYTDLLALVQYLANDQNLDEGLRAYTSTLASLTHDKHSYVMEVMHQYRSRLVHQHAQDSPRGYRPAQLCAILGESARLFPDNSIFHTLHEQYSKRAGRIDGIRNVDIDLRLGRATSTLSPLSPTNDLDHSQQTVRTRHEGIITTLLRLSSMLSRPLYSGTTQHSIRSAFTTATQADAPGAHDPTIWTSWIRWEFSLFSIQPTISPSHATNPSTTPLPPNAAKRLKTTILSGINACPWAKEIYMLALTHPVMRDVFGFKGQVDIYRSMSERGLRIRIDVDDLIDDIMAGRSENEDDSGGGQRGRQEQLS